MASTIYRFYGEAKWAKFQKPDEKYGHFGLDLIMDEPSWVKFKKSELQLKVKETEEGKYISLRRPAQKLIKGELVNFGPPVVTDTVGREFTDLIGNGSIVACDVVVYDTQKGKGHRLDKVVVQKHVPYNRIEDAHDGYDMESAEPTPSGAGGREGEGEGDTETEDTVTQDDLPWK